MAAKYSTNILKKFKFYHLTTKLFFRKNSIEEIKEFSTFKDIFIEMIKALLASYHKYKEKIREEVKRFFITSVDLINLFSINFFF